MTTYLYSVNPHDFYWLSRYRFPSMEKVLISPHSMERVDHWYLTKAILKFIEVKDVLLDTEAWPVFKAELETKQPVLVLPPQVNINIQDIER
ncbi:MAG: hypothetical protein ACFFD4_09825 [Candidatus Odinarchaeota archaeon]